MSWQTDDYEFYDDDDLEPDQSVEPEGTGLVQHLRRQIAAQDREKLEGRQAQRELAIARAIGIDTFNTPVGRLLARNYTGPMDPGAIRAEAVDLGLAISGPSAPAPAPADPAPAPSAPNPIPAPTTRPWATFSRRDGAELI